MLISESLLSDFDMSENRQTIQYTLPLASRDKLSIFRILGICSALFAIQYAYSVEFALGVPIMFKLGIRPDYISLVWIAAPISGLIVQPIVGYYSDKSKCSYGRRRPFVIAGAIGLLIGFILLYFVDEIGKHAGKNSKVVSIIVLTISLLIINIFVNILQLPSRALIGDLVPKNQTTLANSIGSLLVGLAAVVSNLIDGAYISVSSFKQTEIFLISGIVLLIIPVLITIFSSPEEPLMESPVRYNVCIESWNSFKLMPKSIKSISVFILFAWMAYFPLQLECTDFFGSDVFKGDSLKYDENYQKGIAFGMLVLACMNGFGVLYSIFQEFLIRKIKVKFVCMLSQIILLISLIVILFIKNKYGLLGSFLPCGIAFQVLSSAPYAFVCYAFPQEQLGMYMGVVNVFVVVGQQISSLLLVFCIGSYVKRKAIVISCGAVFAVIAAITTLFIQNPSENEGRVLNSVQEPFQSDFLK